MWVCVLFRGDDQKVIEEVEVDADERHSAAVSTLQSQLSHWTLVRHKTAAYDQRK